MRTFLPEDLSIKNWAQIETYFEDLNTRAIDSVEDLKKWMQDRSELEAILEENMAWRYIKMNIDTDLQYAFMTGVRDDFLAHQDYLAAQIGNPDGEDVPNKKYYDPRRWLRQAETAFIARLKRAFEDLNNVDTL